MLVHKLKLNIHWQAVVQFIIMRNKTQRKKIININGFAQCELWLTLRKEKRSVNTNILKLPKNRALNWDMSSAASVDELLPPSANDSMVEIYGRMISDSLKIDSSALTTCLNDILKLFTTYFILIQKVHVYINRFFCCCFVPASFDLQLVCDYVIISLLYSH